MDLLADLIALGRVRGTLGARIDAGADWGWWTPASDRAAFHAVTSGTAWVAAEGAEPQQLLPGDVVLFPRGTAHALGSDPDAVRRTTVDRFDPYEHVRPGIVAIGTAPTRTRILCAHYSHDAAAALSLLDDLPDVVVLAAADAHESADTIRLIGRELADPQPGGDVVLDRMVDVLLVQVLRRWAREPGGERATWATAWRDPVVRAALTELHARPSEPWTTDTLAATTATSRATLARRFTAAVGTTPAAYLTHLRMDRAAGRLRETDDALKTIAADVGYTSVHAFSRAFSKARGSAPSQYRQAERAVMG